MLSTSVEDPPNANGDAGPVLISHRHKFIYVKAPKTASTSIEVLFQRFCVPEDHEFIQAASEEIVTEIGVVGARGVDVQGSTNFNHMTATQIRNLHGADVWRNYFKFSVVRNPFDQAISYFLFSHRGQFDAQSTDHVLASFNLWVPKNLLPLKAFYCGNGEQLDLDFYIKYEALNDGIQFVASQLGIKGLQPTELQHLKRSDRSRLPATRDWFSRENAALIEQYYEWLLEAFGYSWSTT